MITEEQPVQPPVKNMGIIITLFLAGLLFWTLFLLFGITRIQKLFFTPGIPEFLQYETIYGVFTYVGYFAFLLLLLIGLICIFSPLPQGTKGIKILFLILTILSIANIIEPLFSYKYLTREKIGVRSLYSISEKQYNWSDVKKIKVSFVTSSSGKNKGPIVRYLQWKMILPDNSEVVVENSVSGEFALLKLIYKLIPATSVYEVNKKYAEEWDYLRNSVFKK